MNRQFFVFQDIRKVELVEAQTPNEAALSWIEKTRLKAERCILLASLDPRSTEWGEYFQVYCPALFEVYRYYVSGMYDSIRKAEIYSKVDGWQRVDLWMRG